MAFTTYTHEQGDSNNMLCFALKKLYEKIHKVQNSPNMVINNGFRQFYFDGTVHCGMIPLFQISEE